MEKKINQLKEVMNIYSRSTEIGCKLFHLNQKENIYSPCDSLKLSFCESLKKAGREAGDCLQSYIYGGLQAEKLGEPYIYFCPYGLVNWAVPILGEGDLEFFITGGPILMHQVDQLLIEDILKQNPGLIGQLEVVRARLREIQVVDPVRVRYLAELLMRLAGTVMGERIDELEKLQDRNVVSARVAEIIHDLKDNVIIEGKQGTVYPLEKERELITKVKLGDKKAAQRLLNEILGFIYFQCGNKLPVVKSKAIELMVVLARAAIEVGADLEIIFGLEYTYFERINQVEDLDDLSVWLTRILARFIECSFSIKSIRNKDIIYKAMNYIRNNYNCNISIGDVAADVGLSPAYFSKVFKDALDMTYTDYLNKVRIQNSKNYLKEGLSLAEIAQQTGFSDQSYFSKVFKRLEGVSPGKWVELNHK